MEKGEKFKEKSEKQTGCRKGEVICPGFRHRTGPYLYFKYPEPEAWDEGPGPALPQM